MKQFIGLLFVFLCTWQLHANNVPFPIIEKGESASIHYSGNERVVKKAVELFIEDTKRVSDKASSRVGVIENRTIIVGVLGKQPNFDTLASKSSIDFSPIQGKWEAFLIQPATIDGKNVLLVTGSDPRGAAYGVIELSRRIGVSPWVWWADVVPEKKESVILQGDAIVQYPSVKYRGIFLNDECWGLNPWASNTFEKEWGNIGPRTYEAIFELLLRLRANLIWPAMHPCTNGFYTNPENPVMAREYGIIVGSSHAEPMLRNNVDEWDQGLYGSFNYFTNASTVLNYWDERVAESKGFESIFTLGMRGVHDSGMVGASSIEEQVTALEEIIHKQRQLLATHINPDPSEVPQAFTTYKEVLDIYDQGLNLPEDITLVWPEDNYGYIQRLSTPKEARRGGGSGVYYHLSYWGRPHDYLWLDSSFPPLVWEEMAKAYHFNAREIWVVNVGDIKPIEYNTSLFLDMAWDMSQFQEASSAKEHFINWHQQIFGPSLGGEIAQLKWEYHRLNFERRPEFMGWSQTEPTRKVNPTEYNHFEAGDEAMKRLERWADLRENANSIKSEIPERLSDAYFQLVEYPVKAAGFMNEKILHMEKAYLYASQNRITANHLARKSRAAYDSILHLTAYYNNGLANGKWADMMYHRPRSLPVFDMPSVPQWKFNTTNAWGIAVEGDEQIRRVKEIKGPLYLPTFNRLTRQNYFIDIFLKNGEVVHWTAEASEEWILIDKKEGILTNESRALQQRIFVSIDWEKAPTRGRPRGNIRISDGNKQHTIDVHANNPTIDAVSNTPLFIEDRGTVSIYAPNYSRLNSSDSFSWEPLEDLGHTGSSMWVNPLKSEEKTFDPDLAAPSVLEYDFHAERGGEVTIHVYTLPTHPIHEPYSNRFGIALNDDQPVVLDPRTHGRSETWKVNVLRNNAITSLKQTLPGPGIHTLKIYALDPGVILDRILIERDGAITTYSPYPETRVQ